MFKVASWNLNSVRSRLTHVTAWLKLREPDVLLLQELKGTEFPSEAFKSLEQFHDALNRGDLDVAASYFAEDCQNHGRRLGRAGVRTVLGEIKINFPDARLTTLNSVAEGEWVVVRCTYSGTHRGSSRFPVDGGMLVGVQPTGRTFEVRHIHMYRVLDGKIAEHFANRDDVGMMRQLGLLPPPPSLPGQ